ncbi:TPA: HNH endonuclease [Bacillus cereus]|nr:HNH endonuclease [Bacillus cereus]
MSFSHGLSPADELSNRDIMDIFRVANSGGMRCSHYANVLLIISDHTKAIYDDRWSGEVFRYTGMGLESDQRLDYSQNRTLYNSTREGTSLYLFEVVQEGRYIFQGEVYLAGEPYTESQPDINDKPRNVYVFPLMLSNGKKQVVIPREKLILNAVARDRKVKKLDNNTLKK